MSSIVYDYDVEKEKLLLQEVDKFLKKDNPKTYNEFQRERKMKIDKVEVEFHKFLRQRKREISLKDARKVIKENVLPKLSEINDEVILNKEKHLSHVKALRHYSSYQKSDLENFKSENYELKKELLELRA